MLGDKNLMRRSLIAKVAGFLVAAITVVNVAASPAYADDILRHFTVTITPKYMAGITGSSVASATAPNNGLGQANTGSGCLPVYSGPTLTPPASGGFPAGCSPTDHALGAGTFWDYGLSYTVSKTVSLYYTHYNLVQTVERLAGSYTGETHDIIDTLGFNDYIGHNFTIGGGWYYRQRNFQPGGGGTWCPWANCGGYINATPGTLVRWPGYKDFKVWFASLTYGFGPKSILGNTFAVNVSPGLVPRSAALPCSLAANTTTCTGVGAIATATPYRGSYVIVPFGVTVLIPIFHTNKIVPYIVVGNTDSPYHGDPAAEQYVYFKYGINKVFNPNLVFRFSDNNVNQFHQAFPVATDQIHSNILEAAFDIKIHE